MVPVDECRQLLRSLETHYQEFLRHSQDSRSFQPDDRLHIEREYNACTHKYELLLRTQEKGEAPPPRHSVTLSLHGRPQNGTALTGAGVPQASRMSPCAGASSRS